MAEQKAPPDAGPATAAGNDPAAPAQEFQDEFVEMRKTKRVDVGVPCEYWRTAKPQKGTMLDISLGGARIQTREPDTLMGYPYRINQHMAAVQASNKSLAFGQFRKYLIRDVATMLIVRANELHIGSGQIGFYAFSRHDGDIVDAGTDPIKHLTHPSPD